MSELKTNLEQILQEKTTKLIPENIKRKVEIFDVIGTDGDTEVEELQAKIIETRQEIADTRRDLENSAATVTGTGENVTLNQTAEATLKKLGVGGNSKQNQYTGKNLYNLDAGLNTALIKNGDEYTITKNGGYRFAKEVSCDLEPGTYIWQFNLLSHNLSEYGEGNKTIQMVVKYEDGTSTEVGMYSGSNLAPGLKWRSITFSKKVKVLQLYMEGNFTDGAYITFKNFMITEGTEATEYEPYTGGQVSPNPDYPQEAQTVKGNAEVFIQNRNLLNLNYTKENPLTVTEPYVIIDLVDQADKIKSIVKNGDKVKLSCKTKTSSGTLSISQLYFGNGTTITYLPANTATISTTESTISNYGTIQNNIVNKGLKIVMYASSGTSFSAYDFMLEKVESDTAVNYIEHTEQILPLNLPAKNLFNKTDYSALSVYTNDDATYVKTSNKITVTTSNLASTGIYLTREYLVSCIDNFDSSLEYYISMDIKTNRKNMIIQMGSDTRPLTTIENTETRLSVKTKIETNGLVIYSKSQTANDTIEITNILISTDGIKYTPYGTEPMELCKIGDYQDYFWKNENTDKWYLHKEINKHVFTGTETWYKANDNINVYVTNLSQLDRLSGNNSNFICNYFKYLGDAQTQILGNCMSFNSSEAYRNSCYIQCDTSIAQSNVELKNYVKGLYDNQTPILVYSVLKTPADTEITDIEMIQQLEAIKKARSCYEQTNVSGVSSDASPIFTVTAFRDADLAIASLDNRVTLLED